MSKLGPQITPDCYSFFTHETIRGSLKLELEPGKYNKEFRGWAFDTFSSFKIRSASIGPNLKKKRGVGNFGEFL